MLENINLGGSPGVVDILRKLLHGKNIEMKTDVQIEQIQVLSQARFFKLIHDHPDIDPMTLQDEAFHYYLMLMCSRDRQSREEITEAVGIMKKPDYKDTPIIQDFKK